MSSDEEKTQAIAHAVEAARKEVETLELIKSCSKLSRAQEFMLDMAKGTVARGERILKMKNWRLAK